MSAALTSPPSAPDVTTHPPGESHPDGGEHGEHQVVVVFDVTATDILSAGRAVVGLINGTRDRYVRDSGAGQIESWWMPEEPLRSQVDRNDNTPMHLVPDEPPATCSEPSCSDGIHYSGRRDPITDEDLEAGPCPLWGVS
jgi:hypothetical protein